MRIATLFIVFYFTFFSTLGQRFSGTVMENHSTQGNRTLSTLPAGLIFYEGFDNVVTPNLPSGWTTLSAGPSGFVSGTSGNSLGQANENGFWPVPLHGMFAMTNDDVCNCNKSADVLVSKLFDFSELNYARIGFSAFQNGSNGQTGMLQVRVSSGNWFDLVSIIASAEWEDYRTTIPKEYLKSNFQFRFRYSDNNGYASGLAIDDIFISSTPTENFQLSEFYTIMPELEGSGFFPDLMPEKQAVTSHLQFTAKIENDSKNLKNAKLAVNISGPISYSDTSSSWLLEPQSGPIIGLPKRNTFTPYDSGAYALRVEMISDSTDNDITDNFFEESFNVTDSIYRWNTEPSDGTGIWILEGLDRVGSIIQISQQDTIRSAWVGIHPSTEIGARFKVKIFNFQTLTASIFTSSPYQVGEEDLNKQVRIELNTALQPGKYLIAIEKESSRLVINTTAAIKSPFGISYYKSFNQDWKHIGYYPDLMLVFDTIDSDCPAHIQADILDESCPSAQDGSISINAINATQFHSKVWSNGAGNTDSIGGLTPGFYQVFVTDGDCTYDRIFEIAASTPLEINSTLSFDSCSNSTGSIILSSQAQYKPHKFFLDNNPTSTIITNLAKGSYVISMENDLGCSSDTTLKIEGTEPLNISINAQPSGCLATNGKINASPSGTSPYTYSWSNGDSTSALDAVGSGIYHLSVQDSIGCEQVVTVILADSNAPSISLISLTDNNCAGDSSGSIEISATGGNGFLSYTWSNSESSSQITGLNSGAYYLTVSDSSGCSNYGNYSIGNNSAPFSVDLFEEGIHCFGSADARINVLVQGGTPPFSYSWDHSQLDTSQFSSLSVGTYSITATDNENCTAQTSTKIISQPKFFMVIDSIFADSSNNGLNDAGIFLSVFGGTPPYKYKWNNGYTTQDLENVDTGFYSVSITDQFGCSLSFEKYLSNDPLVVNSLSKPSLVKVFPNPVLAKDPVTIASEYEIINYELRDIHGRIIDRGYLSETKKHIYIMEPGLYVFYSLDSTGNSMVQKIIVQ